MNIELKPADNILTKEQMTTLILALAVGRGEGGFTEADAEKVLAWGRRAVLEASIFECVMDGLMVVNVSGDDPLDLDDVSFKFTNKVMLQPAADAYVAKLEEAKKKV